MGIKAVFAQSSFAQYRRNIQELPRGSICNSTLLFSAIIYAFAGISMSEKSSESPTSKSPTSHYLTWDDQQHGTRVHPRPSLHSLDSTNSLMFLLGPTLQPYRLMYQSFTSAMLSVQPYPFFLTTIWVADGLFDCTRWSASLAK